MYQKPQILIEMLNVCECIALLFGLIYYNKIKNTFWKYFVFYLGYVAFFELFGNKLSSFFQIKYYLIFSFIAVPIEFLFFIWLFAYVSLKKIKLFLWCIVIYILSFIPDYSLEKGIQFFNSFNYLIGGFILMFLILLELNRQIKSDNILFFWKNKMFYVTLGTALFYVGNLPFFGLYYLILKEPQIWNSYYIYFMVSNCIMYLLFAASFIWGKPKL